MQLPDGSIIEIDEQKVLVLGKDFNVVQSHSMKFAQEVKETKGYGQKEAYAATIVKGAMTVDLDGVYLTPTGAGTGLKLRDIMTARNFTIAIVMGSETWTYTSCANWADITITGATDAGEPTKFSTTLNCFRDPVVTVS